MSPDQVLLIILASIAALTVTRVAELEERQDFTERVLLREGQQRELGPGARV